MWDFRRWHSNQITFRKRCTAFFSFISLTTGHEVCVFNSVGLFLSCYFSTITKLQLVTTIKMAMKQTSALAGKSDALRSFWKVSVSIFTPIHGSSPFEKAKTNLCDGSWQRTRRRLRCCARILILTYVYRLRLIFTPCFVHTISLNKHADKIITTMLVKFLSVLVSFPRLSTYSYVVPNAHLFVLSCLVLSFITATVRSISLHNEWRKQIQMIKR
jgi:hypothetical protein